MTRYLLFVPALLFFVSCATPPEKEILTNYINRDMLGIARVENAALTRYNSATGKNFTSMDDLYRVLDREVIPTYGRFYHLLQTIRPDDEEVMMAHSLYVRGAKKALEGFEVKKYGIETRDVNLILLGNDRIDRGLQQTLEWKKEIAVLRKARGVKTVEEMDSVYDKVMLYLNETLMEMGPQR